MPYRRTDNVVRKQAARHEAILRAARQAAAEGGMATLQMAALARRAGIAAGTVYRYFPSKTDLVAALIAAMAQDEVGAVQRAADAAPGPLSALSAAIATFAARALGARRLLWALMAEPVEAEIDALRVRFRRDLAAEFRTRIEAALVRKLLPEQDLGLSAPALVGALLEGAVGPLAQPADDAAARRDATQSLTLLALRALGVVDARARGLVVQTVLPGDAESVR
jgi:AcrR family transcriptional regulator